MDDIELKYHRLNTTAFIAFKPSSIALIPQVKERTTGAGYRLVPQAPREPQVLRVIELGANQSPPILVLADGKQRAAEFWLLGEWDAAIEINDYWIAEDGREWIVGDIVRPNQYEVRALVTERGK